MDTNPIGRLPAELLTEVFIRCLPPTPSFSARDAPLLLTHVCRAWREAALCSASLWAKFLVPGWMESPPAVDELVALWLERAGSAPLDVQISMFDTDVQVVPEYNKLEQCQAQLARIVQVLAPRRLQVRHLNGVFPDSLMAEVGVHEMTNADRIFYCGMLGPIPEDEMDVELRSEPTKPALDIGPARSALRSVAICGCAVNIDSIKVQMQLTHLELTDLHPGGNLCQEQVLELLVNLPLLEIAVMDVTRYERLEMKATKERVVLPNLQLLFLTWQFPADISLLLDSIRLPNLQNLGLRGTAIVMPDQDWNSLYEFLEASQPPVKRISFGDFGAVRMRLLDCLGCCPQLEHLTINHTNISDAVFRTLTCTDEVWDTRLLPCLRIFNLGVCEGFQSESLVRFLKSRASDVPTGFAKLTESAIMFCPSIVDECRAEVEACGVENLVLETMENETVHPYARVVETHRELLAMVYEDAETDDEEVDQEVVEDQTEVAESLAEGQYADDEDTMIERDQVGNEE